jgi:hypothetical protein
MINPNLLKVSYVKSTRRSTGEKFYRTGFEMAGYAHISRKRHKTASGALSYGVRTVTRWKRLYQVVVNTIAAQPTPAEQPA